jgi:peptidoglycan/xylan/chitin deacetylase (PgdA/CDA1 family)
MGAILCLHSVTTHALPAEGTAHVSMEAFKSYVRVSRRVGEIVPLGELVRRHAEGKNTGGLIALTFDDAYAALRTELSTFLSREAVPVATFVVTQAAATGAKYWWDRIEDVRPQVATDRWRAFEASCGVPEAYRRGQPSSFGPLRPLRQWLLATYAGRWPDRLEPELAALEQEVGAQTRHRSMMFDELADLVKNAPVEVGVHTVSHPVLPLLSDADLTREVTGCFSALRERFATALPILSIPFGLYDDRTIRVARSGGMAACLTLGGTLLNGQRDRYALPRLCLNRGDTSARLGLRLFRVTDRLRRYIGARPETQPALPSATS